MARGSQNTRPEGRRTAGQRSPKCRWGAVPRCHCSTRTATQRGTWPSVGSRRWPPPGRSCWPPQEPRCAPSMTCRPRCDPGEKPSRARGNPRLGPLDLRGRCAGASPRPAWPRRLCTEGERSSHPTGRPYIPSGADPSKPSSSGGASDHPRPPAAGGDCPSGRVGDGGWMQMRRRAQPP